MRRTRRFEDALEIIAALPPAKRRLLCDTATHFFASPEGMATMDTLGRLPRDHPRVLLSGPRLAHSVVSLICQGHVSEDRVTRPLSKERLRELM